MQPRTQPNQDDFNRCIKFVNDGYALLYCKVIMSGHDKKGKKTGSEMVVGDGKHHLSDDVPQAIRLLKWIGIICGIVLLCAAIVGLVVHFAKDHKSTPKRATIPTQKSQKVDVNSLDPEAKYHYLASTGDYAGAEAALEGQLANANDTTSRLEVYSQQSAIALQFKHNDDAKKYADKAMQLDPNSDIPYSTLAYWAKAVGNKDAAKNYWEQAISKLDPNAPQYSLVQRQYQKNIQGLSQ